MPGRHPETWVLQDRGDKIIGIDELIEHFMCRN
jgi:hypothetical protein